MASKTSTLNKLSEQLAELVTTLSPSVVGVRQGRRRSSGTVWSESEVVVADHALRGEDNIAVVTADGVSRPAVVVGRDATLDLALLAVDGGGLSPAPRHEGALTVGNLAVVLGRPGESARATLGMISVVGGAWTAPSGGRLEQYLEVDASLPSGFSGGPLVSATGGVVGVNTAGLVRGGTTVPVGTVHASVDRLREGGSVKRGYLGVGVQPVVIPASLREAAGQAAGALVTSLEEGGPGEAAGITLGDTLLSVDGEATEGVRDLLIALSALGGREVSVRLLRGGVVTEVSVTLGERARRAGRRRGYGRRRCG